MRPPRWCACGYVMPAGAGAARKRKSAPTVAILRGGGRPVCGEPWRGPSAIGSVAAMASPNLELIESFYTAFDACEGDKMAACYAPDAHFYDPVFEDLNGDEPGAMWRMLTGQAKDLKVELAEHSAEGNAGTARWIANYTFSQTGRHVTNDVSAKFRFTDDGKIADHRDDFSFYGWSKQALGPPGLLLGWTPIIRGATRKRARASLDKFMAAT